MAKLSTASEQLASTRPRCSLKQLLRSDRVLIGGIVSEYLRPSLFKLYRYAGFDFGYIEYEHAWFDNTMMAASVQTANDIGLPIIAKVPELSRTEVGKLLELGVIGIQLPRTESRAGRTIVRLSEIHSDGFTRHCPGYGNSNYAQPADWRTWMDQQNEETVLVVHIETRAGYDHAEEIISTPGIDMLYVGPGDFSIAMGQPGKSDHPDVVGPMEEILAICKRHNVPFGTTASGVEAAHRWISKGARFFEAIDEFSMISTGATQLVRQYREFQKS